MSEWNLELFTHSSFFHALIEYLASTELIPLPRMNWTTPYQQHQVHWHIFGQGERLLIALHGFGDTGAIFKQLPSLQKQFTIYALDLPFHGKTKWHSPTYNAEDIYALLQQALEHSRHSAYAIMGFSYGARILLTLLPRIQHQVAEVYLVAPDGIQGRSGRAARLTPLWLRKALVRLVEPPDKLYALLRWTGAKYWLPTNTYNFLHLHLSRPKRRKRTFNTWLSMPAFPMEPRLARQCLQEAALPTHIYLGKRDPIIPVRDGEYMTKANPTVHLHLLEADHFLVDAVLDDLMREQFKQA